MLMRTSMVQRGGVDDTSAEDRIRTAQVTCSTRYSAQRVDRELTES